MPYFPHEKWNENEHQRQIYAAHDANGKSSVGVGGIFAAIFVAGFFILGLVELARAETCKPVAEAQATHEGSLLVEKRGVNFAGVVSNYLVSTGETDERLFAYDYLLVENDHGLVAVPVRNGIVCNGPAARLDAASSAKLIDLLQRHDWRTRV